MNQIACDVLPGPQNFAQRIARALAADLWVPSTITFRLKDNVVYLEGKASWNFQCDAAERTVRDLNRIAVVKNNIAVVANCVHQTH